MCVHTPGEVNSFNIISFSINCCNYTKFDGNLSTVVKVIAKITFGLTALFLWTRCIFWS